MLRRDTFRLGVATFMAASVSASVPRALASTAPTAFVDAPDVVVFCDPALRAPLQRLAVLFRAGTGAPVRLVCAPGGLMAAQLARNQRDDIFISLLPIIRQLADAGLAVPQASVGSWRNRLVIARNEATDGVPAPPGPASLATLPAWLADRKFGAPDPGPNAVVDTPALIRRLGLEQALAGRIAGQVDTGTVAWMLAHDRVGLGLVLSTEARAGGLSTQIAVPDEAYPAVRYAVAFSRHVLSRNAAGFMRFLASGQARASLTEGGLEIEA